MTESGKTGFTPLGQFLISSTAVDEGGLAAVEVRIDDGPWQRAFVSGDHWRVYGAPTSLTTLPDSGHFNVEARAIDKAGRTTNDRAQLLVDVVAPSSPPLRIVDNGRLLTPGSTIDKLPSSVTFNWTPAAGDKYLAGWTVETAGGLVQDVRPVSSGERSFSLPADTASIVEFTLISQDAVGNEQTQTVGPFYFDAPGTPDLVHDLQYDGRRNPETTQIGFSTEAAAVYGPQQLDASWDSANLHLTWSGAHWNSAGDLWVYLDTRPGGATSALDPYQGGTAVQLPPGFTAVSVVWLEDEYTAQIANWDGS